MSGNYMRVLPREPLQKMYGFEKKTQAELTDIVSRLQRRTYNSDLHHADVTYKRPPRLPSARCRRAQEDAEAEGEAIRQDHRPEKEVERIFRRMRTPTMSYRCYRGEITPLHELGAPLRGEEEQRAQAPDDTQKSLRRLSRPTTASSRRARGRSAAGGDGPDQSEYDVEWEDDRAVKQEELDAIIKRVTSPTVASEGGKTKRCARRKDSIATQIANRRRAGLPLVSGMPKSRDADEITDRVYRPFERTRTRATAVVYT